MIAAIISKAFHSPVLRNVFYFGSRLVFIDLVAYSFDKSLICNGLQATVSATIKQVAFNTSIYVVFCSVAYVSATLAYGFMWSMAERLVGRRIRCGRNSKQERWIWPGQLGIREMQIRHAHFPIDVVSQFYHCIVMLKRKFPLKFVYTPVLINDFDEVDDAAWPFCSLVHTVALYTCRECRAGKIEILRTSLLRRTTIKLHSWPLHQELPIGATDQLYVHGFQSGGFIFVYIRRLDSFPPFILDIYNLRTNEVLSFDTSFLPNTWTPFYFFRDRIQNEKPKTIYVRIICWIRNAGAAFGAAFGVGQSLVEVPADNSGRMPVILSNQHVYFPLPWSVGKTILHRSTRRVGLILKLKNPQFGHIVWRCHCVYDFDERLLKCAHDYRIFMENDQNWSLFVSRFLNQFQDDTDPPLASVLTPVEAIVLCRGGKIWRTKFRASSLKEFALRAFFEKHGGKVRDLTSQQWRCTSGVVLDQHF